MQTETFKQLVREQEAAGMGLYSHIVAALIRQMGIVGVSNYSRLTQLMPDSRLAFVHEVNNKELRYS